MGTPPRPAGLPGQFLRGRPGPGDGPGLGVHTHLARGAAGAARAGRAAGTGGLGAAGTGGAAAGAAASARAAAGKPAAGEPPAAAARDQAESEAANRPGRPPHPPIPVQERRGTWARGAPCHGVTWCERDRPTPSPSMFSPWLSAPGPQTPAGQCAGTPTLAPEGPQTAASLPCTGELLTTLFITSDINK